MKGIGANTLSLVNVAIKLKEEADDTEYPYDQVWVVFDRDCFPAYNFDNAITSASSNAINAAWSNEAFELWYILHFEERITGMSRHEYADKLTSYLGQRYKKNSTEMYDLLQTLGNEENAIRRSERLSQEHLHLPPSRSNPCTLVNKLVKELNRFK